MFKPTNSNRIPTLTRVLVLLAGCTLGFFLTFVLGGWIQSQMNSSPISSVRGLAATIPYQYFAEMLASEIPHMHLDENEYTAFSKKTASDFMLSILTGIKTDDPRTLLAQEIPGLNREKAVRLRGADPLENPSASTSPREFTPSEDMLQPVSDEDLPDPLWPDDLDSYMEDEKPKENEVSSPPKKDENKDTKKNVFIYTSHNRESWIPELEGATDMDDAFHPEINVTLLSKRMADRFEHSGIGALSADIDYPTSIPAYSWNSSYSYSLQSVREASAAYPDLVYFFDIHRDAQPRKHTTATINGEDYAQLYFIIGHRNPNWKENEAFAAEIHERIESKLPGISRGVWSKSASSGHAEYNQSFSNRSLLIEVGGPENTLEESNRTIDALTDILAEFILEETAAEVDTSMPAERGGRLTMEKFLLRMLLIIVLISFGVFYGIDMAGRGMDEVQETQEETQETNVDQAPLEIIELPESEEHPERPFTYKIIESEDSEMRTGWAGKIGKLLQSIAHGAVEGINSVFDRIIA